MSQALRVHLLRPPAETTDPTPFLIHLDGTVGEQDIWDGYPDRLLGFGARYDSADLTLTATEFPLRPDDAVGLYPIFVDVEANLSSYLLVVDRVEWVDADE